MNQNVYLIYRKSQTGPKSSMQSNIVTENGINLHFELFDLNTIFSISQYSHSDSITVAMHLG